MQPDLTTLGTLAGHEFAKAPSGDIMSRTNGGGWRFYATGNTFPMTIAGQYFAGNDEPYKALDGLINGIAPAHLRRP